jgi:glucose/arabinose dehydrogenase
MKIFVPALCLLALACSSRAAPIDVSIAANGQLAFAPKDVTIQLGDTVRWTWAGDNHTVSSGTPGHPDGAFESGLHNTGFTYSKAFTSAGTFSYYCKPHGSCCQMVGSVAVAGATPTPTATPTPSPTPLLPRINKGFVRVELQSIASGLTAPVDLAAAPDGSGRLFVVDQTGHVSIIKNGQINAADFLNVSNRLVNLNAGYDERGLLGIAFHPGFADSASAGFRKLYTFTNEPVSGAADFTVPMNGSPNNQVVIAEWQISASNPDAVDPTTRREVLRIDHPQSNHNGGQIAFRPGEPYLYISLGDGGAANDVGDGHNAAIGNAQDTSRVLGKILRIDPLDPAINNTADAVSKNGRYRLPATNPFVSGGGLAEIYAYGLRNPFRFSFDAASGKFFVGDVGQNNVEEVDAVELGKNYGWNRKEGTFLFNSSNGSVSRDAVPNPAYTNPLAEYSHAEGSAVIGGIVYRGAEVPALMGKYIFGDLAGGGTLGRLFYLDDLNSSTIYELRIGNAERALGLYLKAFGRDANGEIYVLAGSVEGPRGNGGSVFKLVSAPAAPALVNLSTRLRVDTGENVLIGGLIVLGSAPKPVLLRGLGPSLPVGGTMTDPLLELHDSSGALIASNDDWQQSPQAQEMSDRGVAPSNPKESALLQSLNPGAYTAVLRPASGNSGVGLVELYDFDESAAANPVNISTRGFVQTADNVMIGGFIIGGAGSQRVLLRAIGPSLANAGITNALQDPTLELHDQNGALLQANDNWKSTQPDEIAATGIAPSDDRESAILASLAPAAYTAIVRGANDSTGVALVETYQLTQ